MDLYHPQVPALIVCEGAIYANSKDVASYFEKQHDNVLSDIQAYLAEGVLNLQETSWFIKRCDLNPQNGQSYRSFEMTRDGFSLVVMGYTGKKALGFKLCYIAQFNAMEQELRERAKPALPDFTNPASAARA